MCLLEVVFFSCGPPSPAFEVDGAVFVRAYGLCGGICAGNAACVCASTQ
jgi:hypothetical protein